MTLSTRQSDPPFATAATISQPWRAFVDWAAERLGVEVVETDEGFWVTPLVDESTEQESEETAYRWPLGVIARRRRRPADDSAGRARIEFTAAPACELVRGLLTHLAELDEAPHLAPADQPHTTHEIAERLFDAYQVDGGTIHLRGCRLEPSRYWRLSSIHDQRGELVIVSRFVTESGEPLDLGLAEQLGLTGALVDLDEPVRPPAAHANGVANGEQASDPPGEWSTGLVVVRRAAGALQATIGTQTLSIPFDDWARTLTPPPAICPATGAETRHLVAIDDGSIVAAEQTAICEASGRRLLRDDLRTCAVSGRLLAAELCEACPVTREPVASDEMTACPKCRQRVARSIVSVKDCLGCRSTEPVRADSPRGVELLAVAPVLEGWRRWQMAETNAAWIVDASTLWRRLVVVIDRATRLPVHIATRSRFGSEWRAVDA